MNYKRFNIKVATGSILFVPVYIGYGSGCPNLSFALTQQNQNIICQIVSNFLEKFFLRFFKIL